MQVSLALPKLSAQRSKLAAHAAGTDIFASLSEDADSVVQLPVRAWEVPASASCRTTIYVFKGSAEAVSFVGSVTLDATSKAAFTEVVTLKGAQVGTIAGSMMLNPALPEPVVLAAVEEHAVQTDDDAQKQQQTAHEALLSRLLDLTAAMNAATARTQSAPTVHVQAARTAAAATSELEEGEVQAAASARQHAVSKAAAAACEQQEADDVRIAVAGFSFEPRCGAVNWRRVVACNSGRIQRDGDLHAVSACSCWQYTHLLAYVPNALHTTSQCWQSLHICTCSRLARTALALMIRVHIKSSNARMLK
jgi:hypothetical protein